MPISVVIPVYNREQSLNAAIESALAQTLPPREIIVVDDGSRDRSAEVAEEFGPTIRVVRQENAGAAAARNVGILEATGEWIAFLDSDDVWSPDKLAVQAAVAARFPTAKLVFCDTVVKCGETTLLASRFAEGGLYGMEVEHDGDFALYDRRLFTNMLSQSRVITSAVMVRRDLPELQFPAHIWGSEDWALWLRLALRYPFASVDRKLTTMFQQGDNLTHRKAKLYRNDVRVLEELLQEPLLSPTERAAVEHQLEQKRIGAAYFSLIQGDVAAARQLLRYISPSQLGRAKYLSYWLASRLPKAAMKRLARRRVPELT